MIMKGQKRKLPPEDVELPENRAAAEGQRQFILYLSLNKYQYGQELPEPSLRRSVLIANTLRQMTLETSEVATGKNGGLPSQCSTTANPQPREDNTLTGMATSNRQFTLMVHNSCSAVASDMSAASNLQNAALNVVSSRSLVNSPSSTSNVNVCMEGGLEDWESMSSDPDFSLSAAISSILTSLESSIDGNYGGPATQTTQRTPLRSLENLLGPAGAAEAEVVSKQGVRGPWGSWERAEECRPAESCVELMRSSYLGDLVLDDLFQDIDTSLLERELGARGAGEGNPSGDELLRYLPALSSPPASSSSSAPFSSHPLLSFNQNLWYLPSFSSSSLATTTPATSSAASFFSSCPSSSPFPGQGLTREGLELEHLMEVLVES